MTSLLLPPGRNLRAEQRAILLDILAADPDASNAGTIAALVLRTGRGVSDRTIRDARSRLGLGRPTGGRRAGAGQKPRPAPAGSYPDLPRDQAARLAWIAANRPDLGAIECVALLAAGLERDS